jgi:hypothetical protein
VAGGPGKVTISVGTCTPSSGTLSCAATVTGTRAGNIKIKGTYSGDSNDFKSAGVLALTLTS